MRYFTDGAPWKHCLFIKLLFIYLIVYLFIYSLTDWLIIYLLIIVCIYLAQKGLSSWNTRLLSRFSGRAPWSCSFKHLDGADRRRSSSECFNLPSEASWLCSRTDAGCCFRVPSLLISSPQVIYSFNLIGVEKLCARRCLPRRVLCIIAASIRGFLLTWCQLYLRCWRSILSQWGGGVAQTNPLQKKKEETPFKHGNDFQKRQFNIREWIYLNCLLIRGSTC